MGITTDRCVNRLERLICCQIILTASSKGSLLICWTLAIITFAFRSSEVKRLLLDLDPYGGTDPLGMFPLFLKRMADVLAPRLSVVFVFVWVVSLLAGDRSMSPKFQKVIVLFCYQLPTNSHNTSTVKGV